LFNKTNCKWKKNETKCSITKNYHYHFDLLVTAQQGPLVKAIFVNWLVEVKNYKLRRIDHGHFYENKNSRLYVKKWVFLFPCKNSISYNEIFFYKSMWISVLTCFMMLYDRYPAALWPKVFVGHEIVEWFVEQGNKSCINDEKSERRCMIDDDIDDCDYERFYCIKD
jgi:hypothetical protein